MVSRLLPRRRGARSSVPQPAPPLQRPPDSQLDAAPLAPPVTDDFERVPDRGLVPQPAPAVAPVTDALFSRLTRDDIREVESRLRDDHRAAWESAGPLERKRLALALGLLYGVEGVAERTGLTAAMPPAGIHLMGRGMFEQTGGAYGHADMVLEWLAAVGQGPAPGNHVLDFSCSSGRVVRALAAARPEVRWHGCDPNVGAITWARENLPEIDFMVSNTSPPLPVEDGFFDAVFAISVWSHYSAAAALRWLEEMHRVIRPGGHLIFTTHGFQSCAWFSHFRDRAIESRLGPQWITSTFERLRQDGHCFWSVFGPAGDMGVVADDWGLAFFTPEWLMEAVTPGWSAAMFRIGRADGNQDSFALQRRK